MLKPRKKTPDLRINLINGTEWALSSQTPETYTLIIVYRGLHCPICKTYLEDLKNKIENFKNLGVNIIAISSDSESRAKTAYKEWDIDGIPIGYEWPIEEARNWGLYISSGIKDEPDKFIEPGLFLIDQDQKLYFSSVQTMPFARPDFEDVIKSIEYIEKNDYPARGEA